MEDNFGTIGMIIIGSMLFCVIVPIINLIIGAIAAAVIFVKKEKRRIRQNSY